MPIAHASLTTLHCRPRTGIGRCSSAEDLLARHDRAPNAGARNRMSTNSNFAELPTTQIKLSDLTDGAGYRVPALKLNQPNLFTRLGSLGDLVLKVPSHRGATDFEKFVRRETTDPQDIRRNEELERFENLDKARSFRLQTRRGPSTLRKEAPELRSTMLVEE